MITCVTFVVLPPRELWTYALESYKSRMNRKKTSRDVTDAIKQLKNMFPALETASIRSLLIESGVGQGTLQECVNSVVERLLQVTPIEEMDYNHDEAVTSSSMECSCCFEDLPIEHFSACRDGTHIYCLDCIRRHAEALVFGAGRLGNNHSAAASLMELSCIQNECDSTFAESTVQRAMAEKAMERYSELQGSMNIKQAQLDDLS
jgi:hypothetical protein